MIEKTSKFHPDKVADRIAGAIGDYCASQDENAKFAVEVMIGHEYCSIIVESNVNVPIKVAKAIVARIAGDGYTVKLISVPQDEHLAKNQEKKVKAGDNGIFKGMPLTPEEIELGSITRYMEENYPTDGKYIFDEKSGKLIVCQSCCDSKKLKKELKIKYPQYDITVNPLGDWTGGPNSDVGITGRKIGSDLGNSITGGALVGKDVSKADVSANIYCWLMAQRTGKPVQMFCAIGDKEINGIPYEEIVKVAKEYIDTIGGYEALAEHGLL